MHETAEPLLQVRDLRTWFLTDAGPVRAVDGVSFDLHAGETLGIVGESGSGKSVCAKSIMRLLDEPARIVDGSVTFRGRDLAHLDEAAIREVRGRDIAMVFQDPMTSLNPVLRIAKQLVEAMTAHGRFTAEAAGKRAISLLGRMGVTAPERAVRSYPHQYSGGMRQRVMLAMGFSNEPSLLIADEPTTALDVTIQAQILDLLRGLNQDLGTAVILISHDLGVIANICSRVLVMYAGEVVEEGSPEELLSDPKHPYTWALLNAAPRLDSQTHGRRLTTIEGQPPDPRAWPTGCRFRARCPFAVEQCAEHPALLPLTAARATRCWVTQQGGALRVPARPAQAAAPAATQAEPLLVLRGVKKHFALPREGFFAPQRVLRAVDGVDLTVHRGETVGLVGESGCGKSTLARLVTRLHTPTAGSISFDGQDIAGLSQAEIRPLRRRMQMIFQDPYASLNPRMAVGDILAGPLRLHGIVPDEAAARRRVAELLDIVNLPAQSAGRFPHEFSGGQRQRISIARALALQPDLVVADEPVSALDVNIQAQIINLMVDLQDRFGLTYLFIAHDLAVVRHVCDRIVVLYLGKVMEIAAAETLFRAPRHPYTQTLIAAVPVPDPRLERGRRSLPLRGEPPNPTRPPTGCRFVTRCPVALPICGQVEPEMRADGAGGAVACHLAELALPRQG
ncbi:MAG: dipeptide ABC transporter ATP-binding protein [Paracraurococcus sp.]